MRVTIDHREHEKNPSRQRIHLGSTTTLLYLNIQYSHLSTTTLFSSAMNNRLLLPCLRFSSTLSAEFRQRAAEAQQRALAEAQQRRQQQPPPPPARPATTDSDHDDSVNPVTGEINGPKGPEPSRYGDWERKGRVSDF